MARDHDNSAGASPFFLKLPALALAAALMALVHQGLNAGVYRWVDDQGKVHYGDRPPSKDKATTMELQSAPAPAPDDGERREKTRRLLDALESERSREKQQAARAQAEKARRERNCQGARRRLAVYQRANSISRVGTNGERTYLSDEEREQALAQARSLVERWCR